MANTQAFIETYEQTLPSVWRFVAARVPDHGEAQDVTSEVFVRAWESWPRYSPPRGKPVAWIFGIAHRTIADWWRQRGRRIAVLNTSFRSDEDAEQAPEFQATDASPEPDAVIVQKETLAELRWALSELSERERDALALRFAAGLRATGHWRDTRSVRWSHQDADLPRHDETQGGPSQVARVRSSQKSGQNRPLAFSMRRSRGS